MRQTEAYWLELGALWFRSAIESDLGLFVFVTWSICEWFRLRETAEERGLEKSFKRVEERILVHSIVWVSRVTTWRL